MEDFERRLSALQRHEEIWACRLYNCHLQACSSASVPLCTALRTALVFYLLMSQPAVIPVSPLEEEEFSNQQDYPRYDDRVQRRPSRKGKEKELPEVTSPWSNNSTRESSPVDSRPDEALHGERPSSYPPVNDEEEESRRIQEVGPLLPAAAALIS